jgi:2-keto-4-pentenoate hydratase/2-oxohepta-3-ene-1,7-dioic acid hydratase in catechol pathway
MMKFVRYEKGSEVSYGLLKEEKIYKINGDIFDKYEITDIWLNATECKLLAPCRPTKIIAIGLNYRDHIIEMHHDMPIEPMVFMKPSSAVIGHRDNIELNPLSKQVDHEAELGLVIGKTAKNIKPDKAGQYIFGATCFNDVTARDLQNKDGQWTRAKSFDTFAPFGPCIETELDYNNLDIELTVNGQVKQKSNTLNFVFNTNDIVSHISKFMTLYPGDIIATGTPSGVGPLTSGDVVEVKIQGIGTLTNFVK